MGNIPSNHVRHVHELIESCDAISERHMYTTNEDFKQALFSYRIDVIKWRELDPVLKDVQRADFYKVFRGHYKVLSSF